ncbi:hypothetical protein SK128_024326 [Halocaridina rubra]|uniref:Ensconsin n=1 Tax=Halocaridina rubra TaxID=373956 RepID=A0AAN8WTC0_HALRR
MSFLSIIICFFLGGGGDGRDSSGGGSGGSAPSTNGHSAQQPQQQQPKQENSSAANKRTPSQKDSNWFAYEDNTAPSKQQRPSLSGPNELFFGEDDKSSGLSYKDREERLRQLRDRQQHEKQQKLEELKEQAAAAQRFREQQENERRRRLDEIRVRDADRRSQVEERKRIIQQAEQDRREAVLRKNAEREQRMEAKRRNEKSSIVFAFGSSTPRMLDPRDSSSNSSFFGYRRATSTTNVHLADTSISRRASECSDMDLSRKRATSAHSLDRKPDGEDLMTRSMTAAIPATAARRRTDLLPAMPSLRDSPSSSRSSPRHRSPVSVGSSSSKPARAKSAGSDRSAPATPARTPARATTPKKTPSQVKAESAAKKAAEKSKTAATPKVKSQKSTPLQSPAVENKSLPGTKEKQATPPKDVKEKEKEKPVNEKPVEDAAPVKEPEADKADTFAEVPEPVAEGITQPQSEPAKEEESKPVKEVAPPEEDSVSQKEEPIPLTKPEVEEQNSAGESAVMDDQEKTLAQKAAEKPVTGYATEEEYKAVLAEKRRLAREAKEREQELERQRQLEEEERERQEEEKYIRMMEEQKKAEEERLKKAIEEADRNREEEAKKKEEEEKQREEAERIEQQKRLETEERLHREEEERQARKSRVAAIMARTRGKGGSNTPTKPEAKTPSEENKGFDIDMNASMTDSMINNLEAVVEAQNLQPLASNEEISQQHPNEEATQPTSDSSKSSQPALETEISLEQNLSHTEASASEKLLSGIASGKLEEPQVNGDSPVPMDTTPTQSVDLLGSITGTDVNTRNHNGVDSAPAETSQGTDNLDSLDPLKSIHNTTSSITPAASNFEQIIDLGQTKLSNEDAVNSNPPSPFIAFEQNLNKKQSQENTSTVPGMLAEDLLL